MTVEQTLYALLVIISILSIWLLYLLEKCGKQERQLKTLRNLIFMKMDNNLDDDGIKRLAKDIRYTTNPKDDQIIEESLNEHNI